MTGGLIAGTVALFIIDDLNNEFMNIDIPPFPEVMKIDRFYGTVLSAGLIGGGLYLGGLISELEKLRETGLMVFEASFITGVVTGLGKFIFGRARPFTGEGKLSFHPFNFKYGNKYFSLPSGHSSLSFTVSTIIASKFDNSLLKAIIFTPAVLTAFARVYNNQHWFSDIFLGSAIGYLIGKAVANLHSKENISTIIFPQGFRINVIFRIYF
jgi:membrane-associated phospholipid phosphatase